MKMKRPTSNRVLKNINFLKYLCTCNPKQRKASITLADPDAILALVECCINVLCGNVKLTDGQKKRLRKHRTVLRRICRKIPISKRKHILVQKGGFLPFLLAPLLSLVSSVAGAAISRAINK